MDPLDFLRVADALKNSSGEAEIRTAISRAYYAVFNYTRSYFAANDLKLPNHQIHHRLPPCIRNSGVQGARDVAQKVKELYDDRLDADYEWIARSTLRHTIGCWMLRTNPDAVK